MSHLGKLKIFFKLSCRGEQENIGLEFQKDRNSGDAKVTATIPQEADFFFGFASPPGNDSYTSRKHAYESWYVSQLCEILVNYASRESLSSMMKRVNRKISGAYTKEGFKQCSECVDRLTNMVHFVHFDKTV